MSGYLETKNLSVGYHGKSLIEDVSLCVQRGKIVTLIGPNGSGKSTILKTVIGQLPELSGTVYLDGETMRSRSRNDVARRMAILMTARVEPELMTCRDVVSSGRYPYTGRLGVLRDEDKKIVEQSLSQVDALAFADAPFSAVSDGQRQRILLARALCQQPQLIVLDEPTAMLDPSGRREVIDTATKLCREQGITVVLITHHMEECVGADRVIVLSNGAVVADGAPKQVFSQVDLLQKEGLTAPVTVRLLDALRAHGMDVPIDALTVSDCADAVAAALKK